jgi:diguanylate cyclase (GGDEF)-like protein/PAS domain S-box-containing protein
VLIQTSGTVMARFPGNDAFLGRDLSGTPLLREVATHPAGTRRYTSPLDGVARISGYQRATRFPVVLMAAVSRDEVLADWRDAAMYRLGALAALIAIVAITGLRLAGQVKRRRDAEAALREREELFRLLTENSSDMVCRIRLDGTRSYVSPASTRITGYSPEELQDRSAFELINPQDRPLVLAAVADLRSGSRSESTLAYRTTRQSGETIWVEASLHVTHDPRSGALNGLVAVVRDITERKRLESQLVRLARTDGLTEIANRRSFDETLAAEWRRAARMRSTLSVILIDVDRFKAYNDAYGHQAGDETLRSVARALAGVVGRAGDLVARYGGEEFVLLLPQTGADAALAIAEKARIVVEQLGIVHAANNPKGVVTVSAGVASMTPATVAGDRSARLIEAADAALYRAKDSGRNRALCAAA